MLKARQGAKMTFIVQANSYKPGEGSFTVTKSTRKDALETAVGLLGQGMTGVTIMGDGRTYTTPEFAEILKDIEEGVKRVKNIVSDLRSFSHPNTDMMEEVKVAEVAATALRFLGNELKDRVQIHQQISEDLMIEANKNKMTQVFVNLLQNASDAMKTKPYANETPAISIEGRIEDGRTVVAIRDNGPGIDPANVDKIFDPFFTTRDVGEGMGLGLSICYRIVEECGGRINVRTEPGRFAEFLLVFPRKT